MRKALPILLCTVICLGILLGSGCAEPKAEQSPAKLDNPIESIAGGAANTGLILYDLGAMTINTTWGVCSFGYGFVEGNTLLPLYDPTTGKFIAHKF